MKKIISVLLLLTMISAAFAGCNQTNEPAGGEQTSQEQTNAPAESNPESTAPETQPGQSIFAPTGTAPVFSVAGGVYADARELRLSAPAGTDGS